MSLKRNILDLRKRKEIVLQGGGEDAIKKQAAMGKLTARERIEGILDKGSFHEYDMFVEHQSKDFDMDKKVLHGDGVVPRGQGAHIAQLWQPGEFLPPQREAVENNRLSVLQPLNRQPLGRLAIHCQTAQTLQGLPGKIPGIGGASVQNHNVHGRSLLPVLIIHRPALLCNRRQAERSLLDLHGHATIAVPEKAGGGAA